MNALRPGLCFDATGTLFELKEDVGAVYRRVALDFGVDLPAWRLDDAFQRVLARGGPPVSRGDSFDERRENETAGWFDLIRQTFQATDSTVRFEDFEGFAKCLFDFYASADAWRLRGAPGELRNLLVDLDAADYPLAIVSNFDHRIDSLLQSLEIDALFDSAHIPARIGAGKPAAAPFQAAAASMNRPLKELVYIGDDPDEVLAEIESLGLEVISVRMDSDQRMGWSDLRERFDLAATV